MLTREEINEFKRITFEVKGRKLSDEQALDQGLRLIILFDLLGKNSHIAEKNKVATYTTKEQNKL